MLPENEKLIAKLQEDNAEYYTDYTELPDGSLACVCRFIFTYAVLKGLTDWGYSDRWCYHHLYDASDALEEWTENFTTQTEPGNWHRHPATGRRRREDGTIYVSP